MHWSCCTASWDSWMCRAPEIRSPRQPCPQWRRYPHACPWPQAPCLAGNWLPTRYFGSSPAMQSQCRAAQAASPSPHLCKPLHTWKCSQITVTTMLHQHLIATLECDHHMHVCAKLIKPLRLRCQQELQRPRNVFFKVDLTWTDVVQGYAGGY